MRTAPTLGLIVAYGAIAYLAIGPKYANQIWDWRDYAAIIGLILLLWWLLSPRRSGLIGADGREDTSNSLPFRLGKALNRVLGRSNSRA